MPYFWATKSPHFWGLIVGLDLILRYAVVQQASFATTQPALNVAILFGLFAAESADGHLDLIPLVTPLRDCGKTHQRRLPRLASAGRCHPCCRN